MTTTPTTSTPATLTPHPNADILLAIAEGKQLQYAITNGKWVDINSANVLRWISEENNEACSGIRVKPSTIRIGSYDVPEPMRVAPEDETWCYIASTMQVNAVPFLWDNCEFYERVLKSGLCHSTKEAAELHVKALLSFSAVE